jgi:hypothetical protein
MTIPSFRLRELTFLGPNDAQTGLSFSDDLSFVYGASNTGKSFAVKSLDFMLGGNRELPSIDERKPYNRIRLGFSIDDESYSLERAVVGGDFEIQESDGVTRRLAQRHSSENENNLSNYLLHRLGVAGSKIAQDKSGTKNNLSFRDIARLCITDETSIQSESSPVETSDVKLVVAERNVFKMMLTGEDDSALISILKPTEYRTSRTAQVRLLAEMIALLDADIAQDYPDADTLDDEKERVEAALAALEEDIGATRASTHALLEDKRKLIASIGKDQRRASDLSVAVENFEQLQSVYTSDIARLEALEEAGFLLGLTANKNCPICGAPPDAQQHDHEHRDIEIARRAAEAEIAKIRLQQSELSLTISDAETELTRIAKILSDGTAALRELEQRLATVAPNSEEQQRRFIEVLSRRDRITRGLELVGRRSALESQRSRLEVARQERPKTSYSGGLSTQVAQEFGDEVSQVLSAWEFPGQRRVTFDLDTYDLIIDGKRRRDNGKGVRAITHAAFKVALLTFCRKKDLPHPGFLILDTPLVTYRDPISSKGGQLSDDERVIRNSDLKERMFEHLHSLAGVGQFILFDNADPPPGVAHLASIEVFTNDPTEGRQGLL